MARTAPSPDPANAEVGHMLREIAELLELGGAQAKAFHVARPRSAPTTLRTLVDDPTVLTLSTLAHGTSS